MYFFVPILPLRGSVKNGKLPKHVVRLRKSSRDTTPGEIAMTSEAGQSHEVTRLLLAWSDGDQQALDKLTPLVYRELHRLARHYMTSERQDHSLQTTALVNEAYLRLVDWKPMRWQNRAHFFAVSAQVMRRILVDMARSHQRNKRGGGKHPISLEEVAVLLPEKGADLIALDDALHRLAEIDFRKAKIVELRFFGGLTVEETGTVVNEAPFTSLRDGESAEVRPPRVARGAAIRQT